MILISGCCEGDAGLLFRTIHHVIVMHVMHAVSFGCNREPVSLLFFYGCP
jgi:hypothetical protein